MKQDFYLWQILGFFRLSVQEIKKKTLIQYFAHNFSNNSLNETIFQNFHFLT